MLQRLRIILVIFMLAACPVLAREVIERPRLEAMVFSPDGRLVAAPCVDDVVRVWDVDSGQVTATFKQSRVTCVAWSHDGQSLGTGRSGGDFSIWDIEARKQRSGISGLSSTLRFMALSPDGQVMAGVTEGPEVDLWDIPSLKKVSIGLHVEVPQSKENTRKGIVQAVVHFPTLVAFSPDGRELAAAEGSSNIFLWSTSGQTLGVLKVSAESKMPPRGSAYLTFRADGQTIALVHRKHVSIWSTKSGRLLHTLVAPQPEADGRCLALAADGRSEAAGFEDGTVLVWDDATEKVRASHTFPGPILCLAYRRDGRLGVVAGNHVWVWDADKDTVGSALAF